MEETIHALMRPGGLSVARAFRRARGFWSAFMKANRHYNDVDLARAIGHAQSGYEQIFYPRQGLAKETMPFTCFSYLHDEHTGFTTRKRREAVRLAKAFQQSSVSVEVKYSLLEAIIVYRLNECDDELQRLVSGRFHHALA